MRYINLIVYNRRRRFINLLREMDFSLVFPTNLKHYLTTINRQIITSDVF